MLRSLVLFAVLAVASIAHAQRAPDMATLDRGDGITKFGFDVGFSSLSPPPYDAALRFELWGQFLTRSGFGVYGALPLSLSFGGEGTPQPPEAYDKASLGELDLGLLFVLTGQTVSWVFRGGVGFPSSTGGRDQALTRYYAASPRLTDLALATDDWYVRLAISPLIHANRLFLRGDVGFDINLDGNDYHFLRLNIGAGFDVGLVALSLELINTATFGEFTRDEDWFHAIAFTVRFMGERFQPFLSIGTPIDDYLRDSVNVFLSGGLQVTF